MQAIDVTFYGNYYSLIAKLPDISFLVKYIINNFIFKKKLDYISIHINTAIFTFLDLFYIKSTYLSDSITLTKYVDFVQSNWDNFDLHNRSISNTINHKSQKSELENRNRLGDNPDNPM